MWANFHTHSTYCDGKKSIQDVVAAGEQLSLISLGFSSHAPLPFPRPWCMKSERLTDYLNEIRTAGKHTSLSLYAGLEVDFIPGKISPQQFHGLDYTIGSVHFVDQFDGGEGWEIDGPHAVFLDGLERIFRNDIRAAVTRYFELTRMMIEFSPPDIVGHLDKMKIQNPDNKFFNESDQWYRQAVLETLKVIQKSGCVVEVNTRGLYQKKSSTPYPSPWVLQEIQRLQIPITLSSDAHHPDDLINQFSETAVLLRQLGFKKMRILSDGRWQDADFDEHGIKFQNIADH